MQYLLVRISLVRFFQVPKIRTKRGPPVLYHVDFIFANSPLVLANRQEPAEYSSKYHENEKCIACSK